MTALATRVFALRARGLQGRSGAWPGPWLTAAAVLVSAATLLPLGFIGWVTIETGWATVVELVARPRVAELLANTAGLVAATLPLCAVLALALAWLTERSALPGARIWAGLAVAPLAVPAFVQSYAWVSLVPGLHGLGAGVLVSTLAYFPFLYLPVAATLRRLDPALEEAAVALGQAPALVALRVVLPQLRLALCGGALLVGLHLLGEYGLYAMIRFDTFTTAIVDQFQSTFNGAAAHMLAGVLVLCAIGLLSVEGVVRGTARYARLGPGAPRTLRKCRLGRATVPALAFCLGVTALALGVPAVTITRWLLADGAGIWQVAPIGWAAVQSVGLALLGGAGATLAALPMAWISVRRPGRLSRGLESCNYVVGSLPGVAVALALVTVTVRVVLPLYQTTATLLLAYAILFLPRALVALRASIAQAPVGLEEAAQMLGRSPAAALWQVTVRLAAPGAAAGVALTALGIVNELTATQMLAPNGVRTLAMAFWNLSGELDYAAAAPYAAVMIALSLPMTWLLHRQSTALAGR